MPVINCTCEYLHPLFLCWRLCVCQSCMHTREIIDLEISRHSLCILGNLEKSYKCSTKFWDYGFSACLQVLECVLVIRHQYLNRCLLALWGCKAPYLISSLEIQFCNFDWLILFAKKISDIVDVKFYQHTLYYSKILYLDCNFLMY